MVILMDDQYTINQLYSDYSSLYKHSTQSLLQLVLLSNGKEFIHFIKLLSSKWLPKHNPEVCPFLTQQSAHISPVNSFWTSVHRALSSESWTKVSWIAWFSSVKDHFNMSCDAVFWAVKKAFAVDLTSRSCEITIFSSWWPLLIDFNLTPLL